VQHVTFDHENERQFWRDFADLLAISIFRPQFSATTLRLCRAPWILMSRCNSFVRATLVRCAVLVLCPQVTVAAQTYTEGFSDHSVLTPAGWIVVNNATSPGDTSWATASSLQAQAGPTTSLISANYRNAADHASTCTWLVLPPFHSELEMSFWTMSIGDAQYSDRLYVVRSAGGTNLGHCDDGFGDFTETLLVINQSLGGDYPNAWTRYSIPGGTPGQRVALVYFVTDAGVAGSEGNLIGIDTVTYVPFNADLSIATTGTAVAPVAVGQSVAFTLTVANAGTDAATGVAVSGSITTNLGAYTSDCGLVFTGDTFTWSPGTLAVGASRACNVTATVQGPGFPGLEATVTGAPTDLNAANDSSSVGIADRLYVDDSAPAGGDGSSWAAAFDTLQTALAHANRGTAVWVAAGRYYPDRGLGQTNDSVLSTFVVPDGVQLLGGFAGTESSASARNRDAYPTVLSGDLAGDDVVDADGVTRQWQDLRGTNARHLITTTDASAATLIDGFTLTAGWAADDVGSDRRGAILTCTGSSLMTLSDVTVIGSRVQSRAVLNGCTLAVSGSEFVSNLSTDVGAVTTNSGTWSDVVFINNGGRRGRSSIWAGVAFPCAMSPSSATPAAGPRVPYGHWGPRSTRRTCCSAATTVATAPRSI
jgi:uncharacterized repeat protein (TIGR01451 family)